MVEEEEERWNRKKQTLIDEISDKMINGDFLTKIQAAREIRSMIRNRNSSVKLRVKFATAGVIQPLVLLLCSGHHDAREASLLALLNLASRNDRNKEQIVTCGVIPPLVKLRFQNPNNLRELATAAILTLSAAPPNKPPIAASGAIPLLLLRSLKVLILSFCHELVSVGGFDGFPLLERLILVGFSSLVEVRESIGNCDKLLLLDLSECGKLKKLPKSITRLKNLGTLSIDGCSNLGEFTMERKDVEPVEVLRADNVGIESQVSSSIIVYPRSLKSLTISLPGSLVSLSLKNNNLSNESFPASFGSLSMLKELCLDGNQIDSLPDCVRNLSRLMKLSLSGCDRLKTVLCAPRTLKDLLIHDCMSLERVSFHPEASLSYLGYNDTKTLTKIEGSLKKQAISEIDEEMVFRLGWINRQHVKDDKFPTMSDLLMAQGKTFLVQRSGGCGIFTTYFRGNRLPDWVTHISCSRKLHFTLPLYGKSCRIRGLNVCFVTTIVSNTKDVMFPMTEIRNLTKRYPDKIYRAGSWLAPESNEEDDIVWLSHWSFENNEFENGDEVIIHVDNSIYTNYYIDVKEYGVSVVYDDDADDDGNKREHPLGYYKPWKLNIGGDVVFARNLSVLHWKRPNYNLVVGGNICKSC